MQLSATQANKILVVIFLFLQGMNSLTEGARVSRFTGSYTLNNASIFKTYSHRYGTRYVCVDMHIHVHTKVQCVTASLEIPFFR